MAASQNGCRMNSSQVLQNLDSDASTPGKFPRLLRWAWRGLRRLAVREIVIVLATGLVAGTCGAAASVALAVLATPYVMHYLGPDGGGLPGGGHAAAAIVLAIWAAVGLLGGGLCGAGGLWLAVKWRIWQARRVVLDCARDARGMALRKTARSCGIG
jgi:hypothetical protein